MAKRIRVATAGPTIDGRAITEDQIQQMADSYNPGNYGARIWMEHIRSATPDGTFRAYGDVLSVDAERVDGKLALFATIEPSADLKAINKAGQKIYSSIEMHPKFPDTDGAYLTGLAVTDSPASTGTEAIKFNVREGRQMSAAMELDWPYAAAEGPASPEQQSDRPGLLGRLFGATPSSGSQTPTDHPDGNQSAMAVGYLTGQVEQLQQNITALSAEMTKLSTVINGVQENMAAPDDTVDRPEFTGQNTHLADC